MYRIKNCPSTLQEGYNSYCKNGIDSLFSGIKVEHELDFDFEEYGDIANTKEAIRSISVSGVQEKFSAIVENKKIRIAKNGERSTHILKPAPWNNTLPERKQIPANEHLTMQIAAQVYRITTANNGLCFTKKGQAVYITKRFDVAIDGSKHAMEDFASIVAANELSDGTPFKYNGCYEDIAIALKNRSTAWLVDMEQFFNIVVFNYIFANGDAHLKNFSMIDFGEDIRLAPAYDLQNTALHVRGDDFGLDGGLSASLEKSNVYIQTSHPCRLDFERFGLHIGLPKGRVKKILDKYMSLPTEALDLINRSFLNEKMKRSYLRVVRERISRFIRLSE